MRLKNFLKLSIAALAIFALLPMDSFCIGEDVDIRRDATVAAVEKVMPSVVNIATETVIRVSDPFAEILQQFFDPYHRQQATNYSLGSGVIIDENGYVLSNNHVVRRADKIYVKPSTSPEIYQAKLIATDPRTDIAILKIEAKPGQKFSAIKFAGDDDLLLGETVLAMGNPFGLGGSVSRGILSSKSRLVASEAEHLDVPNWLQTDASINPGNSGGPLVNLRGELIGLNVAIIREAQGISFAVPVKRVSQAISEIFTPEAVQELWFGAQLKSDAGALTVAKIQPGSPADKSDLQPGDRIVRANGKTPKTIIELVKELTSGRRVALSVLRNNQSKTLDVQLVPEKSVFNADMIYQKLGVKLQQSGDGFVVNGVDPNARVILTKGESTVLEPASKYLQPGFRVVGIDGRPMTDFTSAAKRLFPKKKDDKVRLTVAVHWVQGGFSGVSQDDVPVTVLR